MGATGRPNFPSVRSQILKQLRSVNSASFEKTALQVFRYQSEYNHLYREYLKLIACRPEKVDRLEAIPYLPIGFFKQHRIQTGSWEPAHIFTSSGTTGTATSRHFLYEEQWYRENALRGFQAFYGDPSDYCILALLPSYLERNDSSLIFMVEDFIRRSKFESSGFFLHDYEALLDRLERCRSKQAPVLLLGVSFALWELAERFPLKYEGLIVMETGGMKGRRREITREELHAILKKTFSLDQIHSEYGMTELLSQAYSQEEGLFYPTPTLRCRSREINDPFSLQQAGKTGAINLIDLANLDTISFIATEDLGKVYPDGSFRILGRMDESDLRGCNLMINEIQK